MRDEKKKISNENIVLLLSAQMAQLLHFSSLECRMHKCSFNAFLCQACDLFSFFCCTLYDAALRDGTH